MTTKPINLVMFAATDAAGDKGLWVTDGTAAGTHELTGITGTYLGGIFGGSFSPDSPDLTVFNGEVLFSGLNAAGNIGLWVTDGTSAGTYELTNISNAYAGGLFNSSFPGFTVFNGEVLFAGDDAAGIAGLWVTDGTSAGTHELSGISGVSPVGLFGGYNADFMVLNGEVLFGGRDSSNNFGLWVTDGTAAGTHELTVPGALTAPGSGGLLNNGDPDFTLFNGKMLFVGTDANAHIGLWVTDGTTAGTHEITTFSDAIGGLTVFKNEVLFTGPDHGLWVTDGTAGGTHELTGIKGLYQGSVGDDFTVFKNEVLFHATDANGQVGLWVTNGTAAGTHELTGIKGASPLGLSPQSFMVFKNEVYFNGSDGNGQYGLWVTNGTAAGTHELTGISGAYTGSVGLNPQDLTAVTLLVQAMASLSPTGSALTASPLNQTIDNVTQPSNHLAQPH